MPTIRGAKADCQVGDPKSRPHGYPLPTAVRKKSPLIRNFLNAIRATGGTHSFVFKSVTAALNIVGPRWARPAVSYGPGDSALDHTPEEHISLEEFSPSKLVLVHIARTVTRAT